MSDLPAGRELDELVCTKVLGWVYHKQQWIEFWKTPSGETFANADHYSTDHNAAFAVVEEMQQSGWDFHCYRLVGGEFWCCFDKSPDDAPDDFNFDASAKTLPHAICLAALATTERE